MAQSPTHKFGQIIGDLIADCLRKPLGDVARKQGLYLDFKHQRAARNRLRKVTWIDNRGNQHDLDYVLEANGSEDVIGNPKAFIEIAYRRYTKHSRNKAQEIQGAIAPLAETYQNEHPFLGAVLAGVFTDASVNQLKSHGLGVLYFPFESVVAAFQTVGIDTYFDENSADSEVRVKVDAYDRLTPTQRNQIVSSLLRRHRKNLKSFLAQLEVSLTRSVEKVRVLALHGSTFEFAAITDAIQFVRDYQEVDSAEEFVRYEVEVRYSNGDEVRGTFQEKSEALRFLSTLT